MPKTGWQILMTAGKRIAPEEDCGGRILVKSRLLSIVCSSHWIFAGEPNEQLVMVAISMLLSRDAPASAKP